MALIERIQKDLTEAMMAKDELRLSVLRMVKSALKNKELAKIQKLNPAMGTKLSCELRLKGLRRFLRYILDQCVCLEA